MTPIVAFWLLENLIQSYIVVNEERAKNLEMRLMEDDFTMPLLRENFLITGWSEIPHRKKLRTFFRTFSTSEGVWAFYCAALACSIGFTALL
ncbi:MAG: hypothetical protein AAFZ17_06975 [Cyanobacteria bacterium J06650_10]